MKVFFGLAIAAVLVVTGCGGDDAPVARMTPGVFVTASVPAGFGTIAPSAVVPTQTVVPPTEITGPFTMAEAFTLAMLQSNVTWEIDVATNDVYVVKPPRRPSGGASVGRPGADSADGAWRAVADGFDVAVTHAGAAAFRVTSARVEGWSARGAMLYLRERRPCEQEDVYLLDVEVGELRVLSTVGSPLERVWSPNGEYIALHSLGQFDRSYEIALIDTATGTLRPLASWASGGELIPVYWTADSRRLGVYYNAGRDFCDLADPPTPLPPTQLEVAG